MFFGVPLNTIFILDVPPKPRPEPSCPQPPPAIEPTEITYKIVQNGTRRGRVSIKFVVSWLHEKCNKFFSITDNMGSSLCKAQDIWM